MNFNPTIRLTRNRFAAILIAILLINNSCLDTIELDIPKGSDDAVVINAKIVKGDPSVFTLFLSQIFSFTAESRGRIIAKNVIIFDEMGNEMEIEPTADGVYQYTFTASDPIQIEIGQSYKLSVEMFDGRIFESTFEPMLEVPEIKSVSYEVGEKTFVIPDGGERTRTVVKYNIDTDLFTGGPENPSFLRWELSRVYKMTDSPFQPGIQQKVCYVSNESAVFDVLIYNGEATTLTELDNFFLYEEFLEREYGEGLYFTVIQESLSKEAYAYWEKVGNVLERKDNIYADPPGKVASNYTHINGEEEVFGYFYVTVQDTARIYLDPELTGAMETRCPSADLINMDGTCGDPICCNCISVENSTTVKPAYWIQ